MSMKYPFPFLSIRLTILAISYSICMGIVLVGTRVTRRYHICLLMSVWPVLILRDVVTVRSMSLYRWARNKRNKLTELSSFSGRRIIKWQFGAEVWEPLVLSSVNKAICLSLTRPLPISKLFANKYHKK